MSFRVFASSPIAEISTSSSSQETAHSFECACLHFMLEVSWRSLDVHAKMRAETSLVGIAPCKGIESC